MSGTKHSQASQMKDIDGRALAAAFESGVAWLGEHKSLIDSLNVFPVPDGDTGTNMYLTVSAALKEAEKSDSASVGAWLNHCSGLSDGRQETRASYYLSYCGVCQTPARAKRLMQWIWQRLPGRFNVAQGSHEACGKAILLWRGFARAGFNSQSGAVSLGVGA